MDFEASGLGPLGYPISVAWSEPGGEVREHHLIRPLDAWLAADGWEPRAEAVHGIPRERLLAAGRPPAAVAAAMNAALAGRSVYVDGLPFDRLWCDQLFDGAGLRRGFDIGDFLELVVEVLPPTVTRRRGWLEAWREAVWRRLPDERRHDAASDVRYLVEFYRLATAGRGGLAPAHRG
jgi:hypothetical protein